MRRGGWALGALGLLAACLAAAALLTQRTQAADLANPRPDGPLPVAAGLPAVPPAALSYGAYAGNTCASCHTAGDERPASVLAWSGGIDRETIGSCPAATRVREEVYYTERMLQAVTHACSGLGGQNAALDDRIAAAREGYSRLLDTPVTSVDAFTAEAQGLRFRLGKVFTQINDQDQAVRRGRVTLAAGLVTLALLVSLAWGLRNTLRLGPAGVLGGRVARIAPRGAACLALVLVLFSLPVFRQALPPLETGDAESQVRQNALDVAGRAATAADRALARSWLLARAGAAWQAVNPSQAAAALAAAQAAAGTADEFSAALWGEAQAVRESTLAAPDDLAQADVKAGDLDAVRQRAWGLRLAAADWLPVDPARAGDLLAQALTAAAPGAGRPRDLDLRAIAVTWAALDRGRGVALAAQIADPALRAWGLRDIAGQSQQPVLYSQAADAARQVADPAARAGALAQIAARSGNASLKAEAATMATSLQDAARAYALAATAADAAALAGIDPAYPGARTLAAYRLGQFDAAWDEARRISDPIERARAQAAIAEAAGRADLARQITDPTLRDRALRDVAIAGRDVVLAQSITSVYYKVQALTALGQYPAAASAAEGLHDFLPLRGLAVAWAAADPQAALALVDKMDREVDRADALRAIAAATGDAASFSRALDMALAARVRNDVSAPVEASLALGRAFAGRDPRQADRAFAQAFDLAQKISLKYK